MWNQGSEQIHIFIFASGHGFDLKEPWRISWLTAWSNPKKLLTVWSPRVPPTVSREGELGWAQIGWFLLSLCVGQEFGSRDTAGRPLCMRVRDCPCQTLLALQWTPCAPELAQSGVRGASGKICLRKGSTPLAKETWDARDAARAGGTPEQGQRRNKKHTWAGGVENKRYEGEEEKQERCKAWWGCLSRDRNENLPE